VTLNLIYRSDLKRYGRGCKPRPAPNISSAKLQQMILTMLFVGIVNVHNRLVPTIMKQVASLRYDAAFYHYTLVQLINK